MDSALFVPSVPQTGWLGTVLPGLSPAELPIAGRRYIDYARARLEREGGGSTLVLRVDPERHEASFADDVPARSAKHTLG